MYKCMFCNVIWVGTNKSETHFVLSSFKFNKKFVEPSKNFSKKRFSCCYFTVCIFFSVVHVIPVVYFHSVIFSFLDEIVLNQNSYLYALVHRIQLFTNIFPLKLTLDSSLFGFHINGLFIFLLLPTTIKNLVVKEQLSCLREKLYCKSLVYL